MAEVTPLPNEASLGKAQSRWDQFKNEVVASPIVDGSVYLVCLVLLWLCPRWLTPATVYFTLASAVISRRGRGLRWMLIEASTVGFFPTF